MMSAVLLLLALQPQAQAQDPVRVGARLTDEEIQAGETTILRVDVETDGPRARIRPFETLPPGIDVVGTRDYDQRQFSLPGGTRRFITREYVLRARAPGRYRIPSVEVLVENDVYGTSTVLLTVTAAPARRRGETAGGEDAGVVLRAWLDSDTVFVGEQVTLEVEAMFSQDARMRLRRAPEYEAPSPSGFWIHELDEPGRTVSRGAGSQVYEVQRFRRAFFPLAPGDYTIPPARLEYEMRRGLLYAPETRELTSDPLPLVVLPIPTEQPPSFTGAVGRYGIQAQLEPAAVPVGEATVLTVVVEGEGNVKALPAPEVPEIPGVDVFPPSQEAETEARGTTIRGRKTFSWVMIPRRAGEIEIPSIRYAYFDPAAGGFETVAVAPLALRATAAGAGAGPTSATFRFLKIAPQSDPLEWVRSAWFAGLLAVPLLFLAVAMIWRQREGRKGQLSVGGLRRQRRQRLRELETRAADPGDLELFADAEAFARQWLRRRLGSGSEPVANALSRAGIPGQTVAVIRTVLDRLAAARYAPTPPPIEEREALIHALGRALERVDETAPRGLVSLGDGNGGGRGRSALLAILLAGGLALPAGGQEPADVGADTAGGPAAEAPAMASSPDDLFDRGIAAFQDGDYPGAAEAFDRYVGREPGDPAGWYNLGTAYHRAGRPGYGVWAWLRALRLDPRDADARHNLQVAGAPPELVGRATPVLPLRSTEMVLLGTLAWLLAGGAGALWLLRRRRAMGITAVFALGAALVLAAAWWTSTRGTDTVIVLESTTLRAGPALQAETVTALEPGTGLVQVDRFGDWVRARTLRGEEGWIEENATGRL